MSSQNRLDFVRFASQEGVLRFGQFKVKSGRLSPYFFNAGLFNTGRSVGELGRFYAQALLDSGQGFDMLFGPAYKGIPLAAATAIALASQGSQPADVPFAFNRKEAKAHGEGGTLVGAPLQGRVVIIDDVITAGTSVRESVDIIRAAGATPAAVLIALDRMERAGADDALSAILRYRTCSRNTGCRSSASHRWTISCNCLMRMLHLPSIRKPCRPTGTNTGLPPECRGNL